MTPARKVVIIMGPTGAGKSALALELAKAHDGEIINADSRQIYVGMDIGTAKPALRRPERNEGPRDSSPRQGGAKNDKQRLRDRPNIVEGVPHYLLDVLAPDQYYSAAQFRDDARRSIADIHRRRKLPIVVGGTGFYLRVLTGDQTLPDVPPDSAFRAWAERQPVEQLAGELQRVAPDLAARVDSLRNRRRVTRALEIARGRRQPHSPRVQPGVRACPAKRGARSGRTGQARGSWKILKLALVPPPETLRQRLEARVDDRLRRGLVEEVRALVERYGEEAPGLQAVGYRQVFPHLRGETGLEETRSAIIRAHRDYARRQRTWLRKEPSLVTVATAVEARTRVLLFLTQENGRSLSL